MANIKFLIRDMDAGNEQTIYITSRFGRNEKLMYATPLKIEPLFWGEVQYYEKLEKNHSNYGHGMSYDRTKWVCWNF